MNWRRVEAAGQDRRGWRRLDCGLLHWDRRGLSTGHDGWNTATCNIPIWLITIIIISNSSCALVAVLVTSGEEWRTQWADSVAGIWRRVCGQLRHASRRSNVEQRLYDIRRLGGLASSLYVHHLLVSALLQLLAVWLIMLVKLKVLLLLRLLLILLVPTHRLVVLFNLLPQHLVFHLFHTTPQYTVHSMDNSLHYYYYRVLRAICCQPVDSSLICFM